jgi:hypothetical protein
MTRNNAWSGRWPVRRRAVPSSPLLPVLLLAGVALAGCQAPPPAPLSIAETQQLLPMQPAGSPHWGYVDLEGEWRIPPRYEYATRFSDGLALVYDGRDWLYIDGHGNPAFQRSFETRGSGSINGTEFLNPGAAAFSEGLAAVAVASGRDVYIDVHGEIRIEGEFSAAGPFNEGIARIHDWEGYGFADSTGALLIPPRYRRAGDFSDGLAPVQDSETGLWGFIDSSGDWVIEPQFYDAGSFSDGLAPVAHEWATWSGYIDTAGEMVIAGEFRRLDPFSSGIGRVHYATHSAYIRTTGEPAFSQEIDDSFCYWGSFVDGLALVAVPVGEGECTWKGSGDGIMRFMAELENAHWAYIDTDGNIVVRQPE